jgi:small-conductance mechanosensitive channel
MAYVRRLEAERMSQEARHAALTRQVEEAHRALQGSLALLKGRIDASDAGLYPANALAADLEIHAELTRKWTEAMGELARFYRDTE